MHPNYSRGLAALGIALISGCATQIIPTEQATHAKQLLSGHTFTHSARLVVKRNPSLAGAACKDRVFADKAPIADLWRGEKVEFTLPPGRHILAVEKQGICPGQLRELSVQLAADEVRTFFIDVSVHGEYVFQETGH